ncbi:MAG: TonB-dependent receptor [Acidobacteria bacterium]|nr:TonB-dependent receptor [Acidobacteriota bacterium]
MGSLTRRTAQILCAALLFVFAIAMQAQNVTGSISGTVTDSSGALLPNSTVTITNTDTNQVVRTIQTSSAGSYSATSLPLGTYTVSIASPGFKTRTVTGLTLHVNDALTVNGNMDVGASNDVISVTADQLQLNFENATISGLITGTQVKELVLNNRNYEQLLALQPGVSYGGTSDQLYIGTSLPGGTTAVVSFSVSGGRNSANNWTIDGVTNVDRGSNLTLLSYPSVDAIREFRTLRNTYTAEFGGSSNGQINVVTRSGTNAFHGTVYEFFRNDVLNANDIKNKQATDPSKFTPRSPLRYNDFGGTVGGPLWRDKAFFFFSGEYRRVINYASSTLTGVPTAAERQGNFSTPVCTSVNISGTTPSCASTGTQVTNISPTAAAYIKDIFSTDGSKIPLPIATATDTTGHTLIQNQRSVYNENQEIGRLDYNLTKSLLLTGRVIWDDIPTVEPGGLFAGGGYPGNGTTVNESHTNVPGRSILGRFTWTASPTLVLEGGYSYSTGAIVSTPTGYISRSKSPDINPTLPYPTTLGIVPLVTMTAATSLNSAGVYDEHDKEHGIFAQVTKNIGRHTVIIGAQYARYMKTENSTGTNAGSFSFTSAFAPTGTQNYNQSFANFLSGYAATFTQASVALTPLLKSNMLEAFVQDNWKVTPRFTANLGVRYSFFGQPHDENKLLDNFDPATFDPAKAVAVDTNGQICYTGSACAGGTTPNASADVITLSNGQKVYVNGTIINSGTSFGHDSPYGQQIAKSHNLNFAPRLGFAWDARGNQKTVVRGGYGIAFDSSLFGTYEQNSFANAPFVQSSSYSNVSFDNPAGGTVTTVATPNPAAVRGTTTDFKTPYTQHYSLGFQQSLPWNSVLSVDYVGEHAVHLLGIMDINQVAPGAFVTQLGVSATTSSTAACASPNQAQTCTTQTYRYTSSGSELPLNRIRPYKGYNAINVVTNLFGSNYNSLQTQFQKRFAHNSLVEVNYTYSKALTDNQTDRSTAVQDRTNIRAEYGRSQLDRKHIFTADFVYALPWFYDQKGFIGHVVGGWELSGVVAINSGLPFTPSVSNQDPAGIGFLGASAAGGRPDQVGDPSKGSGLKTTTKWFNTAAFAPVPLGQVRAGNSPRGAINGPGYQRWDVGLFRNFRLFGPPEHRVDLQFRAEAFNVFNHNNPASINTTAFTSANWVTNNTTGVTTPPQPNSAFGNVNVWRDPRIMQLAVKINY